MTNKKRKKREREKANKPNHNFAPKTQQKGEKAEYDVTVELTLDEFHGLMNHLTTLKSVYAKAFKRMEDPDQRNKLEAAFDQADACRKMLKNRACPTNNPGA